MPASIARHLESLEPRCLAAAAADGLELWWKLNMLRVLSNEALNRLELSGVSLVRQALAPLAWNTQLKNSANYHANEMGEHNYFAHQSLVDSRWPNQLVRDMGYPLPSPLLNARNDVETIFASTDFAGVDDVLIHMLGDNNAKAQLFPAPTAASLVTESGIGKATYPESSFDHYWVIHAAGRQQGERFFSGVVYSDLNNNQSFDAGEGIANIRVSSGELMATTNENGVYSFAVAGGRHQVSFHDAGQNLLQTSMLSVGEQSVAIDLCIDEMSVEINFRQRSWWTNADQHLDANRDKHINPIDALVVINHLNRHGVGSLGSASSTTPVPLIAVDTTGDSYVTATDALIVINYLNRG